MPIPVPKKEENEKNFIKRCMSSETMLTEYPDNEVRAGICYSQWRNSKKPKKEKVIL